MSVEVDAEGVGGMCSNQHTPHHTAVCVCVFVSQHLFREVFNPAHVELDGSLVLAGNVAKNGRCFRVRLVVPRKVELHRHTTQQGVLCLSICMSEYMYV